MKIGAHEVGGDAPCFIVAELGINHNGSIEIAKKLIDVAKDAGAQAVKSQKRTVELVYSAEELARPRESPFGKTNGDLKRGLEFGVADYQEIDRYCKEKKILWFASPWDCDSVKFLEQFGPPCYKIASACLTDDDLISLIAGQYAPVIMSTGMSSFDEVDHAVAIIDQYDVDLALLACTSTYPSKLEDLNLARINALKEIFFENVIGWSHHAVSPWMAFAAVAMGAKIIECHLTLDRSMFGSDQSASLEPQAFAKLITEIRDFEKAFGNPDIKLLDSEKPIWEKLRRVK